jgi:hypothetical protein
MSSEQNQGNSRSESNNQITISSSVEPTASGNPSEKDTEPTYYPFYIPKVAEWLDTEIRTHRLWRRFKRSANALLVIATILILCVYYGQLRQMKKSTRAATKSVKLIEKNERIDQRAWVTVRQAKVDNALTVGQAPVVTLSISNSGKTPALRTEVAWAVFERSSTPDSWTEDAWLPAIIEPAISQIVVGPNGDITAKKEKIGAIVDTDEIKTIRDGDNYLYARGFITYYDIFKQPHRTEFCYRIHGKELDQLLMQAAESGNNAN